MRRESRPTANDTSRQEAWTEAMEQDRNEALNLFNRLRNHGEPQLCRDAANLGVALVMQRDADAAKIAHLRAVLKELLQWVDSLPANDPWQAALRNRAWALLGQQPPPC